jgi:hypothetical protein
MKVPEVLKMEYMNWWEKSLVIAGLLMLLAICFILGLWEGYKISVNSLSACQSALMACRAG